MGWTELPRYSFEVPPGWEEVPVSIADLGGTEVGVRLPGPIQRPSWCARGGGGWVGGRVGQGGGPIGAGTPAQLARPVGRPLASPQAVTVTNPGLACLSRHAPAALAQIDLRFGSPQTDEGQLQVVVAPVLRFRDVGTNADVRIDFLGPPKQLIEGGGAGVRQGLAAG